MKKHRSVAPARQAQADANVGLAISVGGDKIYRDTVDVHWTPHLFLAAIAKKRRSTTPLA